MRNRLLAWGLGLTAARVASGLLSRLDSAYIVFVVVAVGTVLCALITSRRGALWTFPLWYLVYGATRVVDFGEYGGSSLAYGAAVYYWGSALIPVTIVGLGCVSALQRK
jgi:hypothetical protein